MTYAYRLMNMIKLVSAGRKICEESLSTIYFPYRSVVSFGETTRSIGVEGKTQVIIKFSSFVISTSLPVFVHTPTSLKKKELCNSIDVLCTRSDCVLVNYAG